MNLSPKRVTTSKKVTRPAKKSRLKHNVCKPCWELKYCPYGPLVEYFPLFDEEEDPFPLTRVKESYKTWLTAVKNGDLKTEREVLEAIRQLLYLSPDRWKWISQFRTEELCCSVFGHICPVFFTAEPFTETKACRYVTRVIPREVMLKVIRRDGPVCSECRINVPDNQIEFDHIIPIARGGPTTAENLRVLCRSCNRKKSDALAGLLAEDPFHRDDAP